MTHAIFAVLLVPSAETKAKLSWVINRGKYCRIPRACGVVVQRQQKIKRATKPLPSWGPTCGQNGYITHAVFGVTKVGTKYCRHTTLPFGSLHVGKMGT